MILNVHQNEYFGHSNAGRGTAQQTVLERRYCLFKQLLPLVFSVTWKKINLDDTKLHFSVEVMQLFHNE